MKDTAFQPQQSAGRQLPLAEFVALLAMLMATVAFSIDSILPSLPQIAQQMTPENVNQAQLVVVIFMLGMGLGTFVMGPISDAIGRKWTIAGATGVYILGAGAGAFADNLTLLLAARFVQGLGASAARTVPMALIRDLYSGPQMAKITSIIMMFFVVVPALAPTVGGMIDRAFGWRGLFVAYVLFGVIGVVWLMLRQPETLAPENRRPFAAGALISGAREVWRNSNFRIYSVALALGMGQMFTVLSSAQQLYAIYGVHEHFPYWFGACALVPGVLSALNARFVSRFGMFAISRAAFFTQIFFSAATLALLAAGIGTGWAGLILIFLWNATVIGIAGASFGNLNALAMQPMGRMAGMAASVITAFATVGAVLIAGPVGQMFNGTPYPLVLATFVCSTLAWWAMGRADRSAG